MGGTVIFGLVVLYLTMRHGTPSRLLLALGSGDTPLHDFEAFFYPMGQVFLHRETPVFIYSAWAALLFVPLGFLPYVAAAWIWFAVLVAATLGIAAEAARSARHQPRLALVGVALVASAMPIWHDLKYGQVSLLLVLGILTCLRYAEKGRPVAAGGSLAAVIAIKFYPALFLAVFAFRGQRKLVVATGSLVFVLIALVPMLAVGLDGTMNFYQSMAAEIDRRFGGPILDHNSQSFESLMFRMLIQKAKLPRTWMTTVTIVRYASCAAFLFVVWRLTRRRDAEGLRWAFMWMLVATPFFVSTSWPHYFVYLPVVTVVLLDAAWQPGLRRWVRHGLLALPLASAALTNMFTFDALHQRIVYTTWGFLFYANLLLVLALVLATLVQVDPRPHTVRAGRDGA